MECARHAVRVLQPVRRGRLSWAAAVLFLGGCQVAPGTAGDDGQGGEGGAAGGATGEGGSLSGGDGGGEGGQGAPGSGGGLAEGGRGADPQMDAGASPTGSDGGVEAGPVLPPPAGTVPMFVAAGNGGRTVTSCDDGLTWVANHVFENRNEDHSRFTHKGFAYGKGWFVSLMGWGAWSSIKVSDDGVTWKQIETPFGNTTLGSIAFDGEAFVAFGQSHSSYATVPSGTWTGGGRTGHSTHLRGGGGGAAADGRGAVAGGGDDATAVMSWDGGKSWMAASGCPGMSFSNLGQLGGAAFGNGALVIVSDSGDTCRVTNRGAMKTSGRTGGGVIGKVSFFGDRFLAVSDSRAYTSGDGVTWQSHVFVPQSVRLRAIARSAKGTYVGIGPGGGAFFRSMDAVTWTKVSGPSGTELIDLHFGYGRASTACPAAD